jgi:hypothetical protein
VHITGFIIGKNTDLVADIAAPLLVVKLLEFELYF